MSAITSQTRSTTYDFIKSTYPALVVAILSMAGFWLASGKNLITVSAVDAKIAKSETKLLKKMSDKEKLLLEKLESIQKIFLEKISNIDKKILTAEQVSVIVGKDATYVKDKELIQKSILDNKELLKEVKNSMQENTKAIIELKTYLQSQDKTTFRQIDKEGLLNRVKEALHDDKCKYSCRRI